MPKNSRLVVLGMIGCLFLTMSGCLSLTPNSSEKNPGLGGALAPPLNGSPEPDIQGCVDLNRSEYGIPPSVFEKLPPPPKCFSSLAKRYEDGQFALEPAYAERFYLQPEFYPSFQGIGLPFWTNPLSTHWGVVGYGVYPPAQTLHLHAGEHATAEFFVHTGFGVRTYQGIRFVPTIPAPTGEKNPITITLDENATHGILLGPAFPKFEKEWAYRLTTTITVPIDTPPQTIEVAYTTQAPDPESEEPWVVPNGRYYHATDFIGNRVAMRLSVIIDPT